MFIYAAHGRPAAGYYNFRDETTNQGKNLLHLATSLKPPNKSGTKFEMVN